MNNRTKLILWDSALISGIMLFLFWNIQPHSNLIIGLITVLILSNCAAKHIAAYKLTGKIY
ncbi:hypothetical protein MgSA37_04419 [Mucilaginibacter gotjawali]|uniref:Uncharacterized protein n=2 Tax=Mucilaginibacter gotjawali TaxID=1550579 RepID=A0A0X8X704_9SPHI|nr:hypothetical protein [Mucilaginibacter gotjawali]BAU56222.1 hypothetical protein MgSA37_04419 [Mucilaginibacter gotjawali]